MNHYLTRAIRWHQQGKLEKAERAYRSLLRQNPGNADALHFLGMLRYQQGNVTQAVKLIGQAIELQPDYADAYQNLGRINLEQGDADAACKSFQSALELQPGSGPACSGYCVALRIAGRLEESIEIGRRATALAPDLPGSWVNLATALKRAGKLEDAIDSYHRALDLDGGQIAAHSGLADALYRMEQLSGKSSDVVARRVDVYRQWLENDQDNITARYMLAAVKGDASVRRAPDEYVRQLFDDFAPHFDQNLERLGYRVPGLVEARLQELEIAEPGTWRVLDAGCGTGLCASFLRPVSRPLVGVDLSAGMLEKASSLDLYDELHEVELGAYLATSKAGFDLIICADTLCYFGDLENITHLLAGALTPSGYVLFTVENCKETEPFRITTSGRYSHSRPHVLACLEDAGLDVLSVADETLRSEQGHEVQGLMVTARR